MKNFLIMNLCKEKIEASTAIKLVNSEKTISELITSEPSFYASIGIKKIEVVEMVKNALIQICHDTTISIDVFAYFGLNHSVLETLKESGFSASFQLAFYPKDYLKKKLLLSEANSEKITKGLEALALEIDTSNAEVSSFIASLLEDEDYIALIERDILNALDENYIEYDILKAKMDKSICYAPVFDHVLKLLQDMDAIEYSLFGIKKLTLHLAEYLITIPDSKNKDILMDYLHGSSFEAISKKYNVTLSFVKSSLDHMAFPILVENMYVDFYKKYYFNADDFCKIFAQNLMCYRYIELIAKNHAGKRKILEILEDSNASSEIKLRVQNTLGEYAYIYGIRVTKKMANIFAVFAKYHLQKALDEAIIERNFRDFYFEQFHENITFTSNQLTALLNDSKNIILGSSGYRYYDIANMDIDLFYRRLNLVCYDSVEISSRYLFEANEELMNSYQINDEYELFSIMRKTYYGSNIEFVRKSDLIMNGGNRNNQIKSLIIKKSPIALNDFVKQYAFEYGVKEKSFANYVTSKFSPYYNKGILDCTIPSAAENKIEALKALLSADFYFIKDIYQMAYDNKLSLDETLFQRSSMDKLGYECYNTFILKKTYPSLEQYFETFFQSEILDLTKIDQRLVIMPLFQAQLRKHVKQLDYLRLSSNEYISTRKFNVNEFERFAQSVNDYIYNDEIFTITSLIHKGFSDTLLKLGYPDIFYASILEGFEDFITFVIPSTNTYLIKIKYVEDELNLGNLIYQILDFKKHLSLADIMKYLDSEYGIKINEFKLKQTIASSTIYYDTENDVYYCDYEAYLNRQ